MTQNYVLLRVFYLALNYLVIDWYIGKYIYFKDMFVILNKNDILISNKCILHIITENNIDCIVEANHKSALKIFNVIHIFTKDNRYFYFTNDIHGYKSFKKILKNNFSSKYIVKKHFLSCNIDIKEINS